MNLLATIESPDHVTANTLAVVQEAFFRAKSSNGLVSWLHQSNIGR